MAQNQNNIWHFGWQAGINFNGTPVPLNNGVLATAEGSASIADGLGNLLFYTDGVTVWDASHSVMINGNGLLGSGTSTQSAIIVQKPGNNTIYYIFTVAPQATAQGIRYSEVDMSLNNNLGAITANKNIPLLTPATEKITTVLHGNGQSIWVIVHGWNNNTWVAYEVTATGVSNTPVTSNAGANQTGNTPCAIGQLKASPDGSKIAYAGLCGVAELLDFDNCTGVVSNPITLPIPLGVGVSLYGCEFSPNGNALYYSSSGFNGAIYQFDVSLGTPAAIQASINQIFTNNIRKGSIQAGPDGKLYIARMTENDLGVINQPNTIGAGCNYVDVGFNLGTGSSRYGLPNFVYTTTNDSNEIIYTTGICDTACFSITDTAGVISISWNFDDVPSGVNNTSTLWNPCHVFTASGNYHIQAYLQKNCTVDTLDTTITILPCCTLPILTVDSLGASCFSSCDGSAVITAFNGSPPFTFLWDSNANSQTDSIATGLCAGLYSVTVTDANGCDTTINVVITEPDSITVQVSLDDTICQTEFIELIATAQGGDGNYVWDWNNGQFNNDTINVSPTVTTTYTVSVTDGNGCPGATATVTVFVRDLMTVDAFRDTTICLGDSTMIWAGATGGDGNYTYTWDNGIGPNNFVWVSPASTTTYHVTVNDGCSTPVVVDSVTVIVGNFANPVFVADNAVGCSPLSVTFTLDTIINGYTYTWDFGDGDGATSFSQTANHTYHLTGTQQACYDVGLTVTTDLGCVTDVVYSCMVTVYPNPIADFTMDPIRATTLDPIIEFYDMSSGANAWQYDLGDGTGTDQRNFYHTYLDSGAYDVTQIVFNQYGCSDTITKTVYVDYVSTIYFPNAFSPEQQDGINDGFAPVFEGISEEDYNFTIFDRWGQVLFTTTDTQKKWDGDHYKTGNPVPQGVYVYQVNYKQFDGLKETVRGSVTLIR